MVRILVGNETKRRPIGSKDGYGRRLKLSWDRWVKCQAGYSRAGDVYGDVATAARVVRSTRPDITGDLVGAIATAAQGAHIRRPDSYRCRVVRLVRKCRHGSGLVLAHCDAVFWYPSSWSG